MHFLNEYLWILTDISLKCVPKGPINNIPALVQIMTWHWPGNKPLCEPMMVSLLTHICVTRPQWVNGLPPALCQTITWASAAVSSIGTAICFRLHCQYNEWWFVIFWYCLCIKYIYGLVQDCSNSIANALELLQSCSKPWNYIMSFQACWLLSKLA